jgi:hypothetical protein
MHAYSFIQLKSVLRILESPIFLQNDYDAERWGQRLVGKKIVTTKEFNPDTEVTNEFDFPFTVLLSVANYIYFIILFQFPKAKLPTPYRLLQRNSVITLDYRTNRLNIEVDKNNVVTVVWYG